MFACCVCDTTEEELHVTAPEADGTNENHDAWRGKDAARAWTPEEKNKEKERLSKLVRTFAKQALAGVGCTHFDHTTGNKQAAQFQLDKGISSLTVKVGQQQIEFLMSNLHEIYTWQAMKTTPKLANFVKMPAFQTLSSEEKERLVMMEYIDAKQYLQRLCIFEDRGPEAAEDFINCIKILRLFSVSPSPR